MKYLKSFENYINVESPPKELEDFFKKYTDSYTHYNKLYTQKIPTEFHEEYKILFFLYGYSENWKQWGGSPETKKYNRKIKNLIKKYTLKSILKKFDDKPNLYFELEKIVEEKPLKYIYAAAEKYTYFLFDAAIRKAPEFIKQSQMYNM